MNMSIAIGIFTKHKLKTAVNDVTSTEIKLYKYIVHNIKKECVANEYYDLEIGYSLIRVNSFNKYMTYQRQKSL